MNEQEVRAVLEAKRAELVEQRSVLTRPQPDRGSISFGKRVGDETAMAVDRLSAVTAHDSLGLSLKQVQRALDKLAQGSYGSATSVRKRLRSDGSRLGHRPPGVCSTAEPHTNRPHRWSSEEI